MRLDDIARMAEAAAIVFADQGWVWGMGDDEHRPSAVQIALSLDDMLREVKGSDGEYHQLRSGRLSVTRTNDEAGQREIIVALELGVFNEGPQ